VRRTASFCDEAGRQSSRLARNPQRSTISWSGISCRATCRISSPTSSRSRAEGRRALELKALVEQIAMRIGRVLERRGLIERDRGNAWPRRPVVSPPPD